MKSSFYGNLYEIKISEGTIVQKNQVIMLVEVMKMSIAIVAPTNGKVVKILAKIGKIVNPGDILTIIEETEKFSA